MVKIFKKVLSVVGILSISLLLSGCIFDNQNQEKAKTLYDQGTKLERQSKYADALDKYLEANKLVRDYDDPYLGIARIYNLKGQTSLAVETLTSGISNVSDDEQIALTLGEIQYESKDYKDAISTLTKTNEKDFKNEIYLLLAKSYLQTDDAANSVKYLKKVSKDSDVAAETALLYALSLENSSDVSAIKSSVAEESEADIDALIAAYQKYEADKQNEAYMRTVKAYLYTKLGFYSQTVALLESVSKAKPEYFEPKLYLGIAYEALGEDEKAEAVLQEAMSLSPANAEVYYVLAQIQLKKKNFDEYSINFESAIAYADASKKPTLQLEYAKTLGEKKLYTTSEKIYSDLIAGVVKTDLTTKLSYQTLLAKMLLFKAKDYAKADSLITAYMATADFTSISTVPELRSQMLGLACGAKIRQGERVEGEALCQQSLDLDKNSFYANYFLGYSKYDLNKKEEAKELIEKAVDLDTEGYVSAEAKNILKDID